MKVIVITDAEGKLLGAHRNVAIKHGGGTLSFRPVTNERQKSRELEVDDAFFSRPAEHCHKELTRMAAALK
jgi:hypothetical protein